MEREASTADTLYLSPHLDDAALSCGGRIYQQAQAGLKVVVLTIFAGSAKGTTRTPFAQQLETRWGTRWDAIAMRRQEDVEALSVLGAVPVHWAYEDCIYRRAETSGEPLYATREAIFDEVSPDDSVRPAVLAAEIERLWQDLGQPQVYAMLSAGNHVDHQIAAAALVRLLEGRPLDVIFYEDYPYAEDEAAVQVALGRLPLAGLRAEAWPLTEEALEAKLKSVACYRSQIGIFWEDTEAMRASVRAHALRTGDGQLAEAYWSCPGCKSEG